jgi:hypothetical protein
VLVDEHRLILQPVARENGLPPLKDLAAPLRLEFVDAQTRPAGAALHVYRLSVVPSWPLATMLGT